MDIEILKEEYSRKMEKALRRGDFALFDNLRRQSTDYCKPESKSRQKQSPTP